jgi:hypothetical protein
MQQNKNCTLRKPANGEYQIGDSGEQKRNRYEYSPLMEPLLFSGRMALP